MNRPHRISTTVLLESAWVLRSVYGLAGEEAAAALRAFSGLPGDSVESPDLIAEALGRAEKGRIGGVMVESCGCVVVGTEGVSAHGDGRLFHSAAASLILPASPASRKTNSPICVLGPRRTGAPHRGHIHAGPAGMAIQPRRDATRGRWARHHPHRPPPRAAALIGNPRTEALGRAEKGMAVADALHLGAAARCEALPTFDRRLIERAGDAPVRVAEP